jgi:hypothetical protein
MPILSAFLPTLSGNVFSVGIGHFSSFVAKPDCRGVFSIRLNHLQHSHLSSSSAIPRLHSLYSLLDGIVVALDHSRLRSFTSAMVDLQILLAQVYRCPHILACQALRDFPILFQQVDLSSRIDFAEEMDASLSQRQLCGQGCDFSFGQLAALHAAAGFFHRQSLERRWRISFIPTQELGTLALISFDRREVILFPEALGPEMIDAFDQRVALGFSRRNEDQLDAEVQRQTNKLPEPPRPVAQSGKGRVVVKVQEVRHSHHGTSMQEMMTHRKSRFVGAAGLTQSVRVSINRVKDEDFGSAFEVASDPIASVKGPVAAQSGSRIVRGRGLAVAARTQSCGLEPTVDGGERGQRPDEPMRPQFLPEGARSAQSHLSALEVFAQAQDHFDHSLVVLLRGMLGSFGKTIQGLPTLLRKPLLPLKEPGARARDVDENLRRRFPFVKELERQTAVANFIRIFLVHKTHITVVRNEKKDRIYGLMSQRIHDVVRLLPN